MNTLFASTTTRWLNDLVEIEAALQLAENLPGTSSAQWSRLTKAKGMAMSIREQLLWRVVGDVEVETKEEV